MAWSSAASADYCSGGFYLSISSAQAVRILACHAWPGPQMFGLIIIAGGFDPQFRPIALRSCASFAREIIVCGNRACAELDCVLAARDNSSVVVLPAALRIPAIEINRTCCRYEQPERTT